LTDSSGRFEISGLAPGETRLLADAPGYLKAEEVVQALSGDLADNVELVLEKGFTIIGTVSDERGQPIIGVEVNASPLETGSAPSGIGLATAISDGDGGFRLEGLPRGTIRVVARHPELATKTQEVAAPTREPLHLVMSGGTSLAGTVIDTSGQALSGVTVSLLDDHDTPAALPETSGADGRFRFESIASGSYRLTGSRRGLAQSSIQVVVRSTGSPMEDIELVLETGGTVGGSILGGGAEQLSRVQVWAHAGGSMVQRGTVDSIGGYEITGLAPGEWTVVARCTSPDREASGRITIGQGQDLVTLDLDLEAALTISGTVLAAGVPAVGVIVSCQGGERAGGAVTDSNGRFTIGGLEPGSYVLTAMDLAGDRQSSQPVTLDDDLEIELSLPVDS
jgi:hypothetical protein